MSNGNLQRQPGGDNAGVETDGTKAPEEARMFDLAAAVHHHFKTAITGDLGSFLANDAELQPQNFGPDFHGLAGDVGRLGRGRKTSTSSWMTSCNGWGGYTIGQLIRAAQIYRADCSEEDDELLTILQRERPSELPLWLMPRLVGICRHVAGLPVSFTDLEIATRAAIRGELLS